MLSLSEPCATSCGLPIANITWLGSREPDVQALPEDACIPLSSSKSSNASPSIPSKQKLIFPYNLLSLSPFNALWGILESPSMILSLLLPTLSLFLERLSYASSSAFAIAPIPGTFSVPALRPASCAPPSIRLESLIPLLAYKKPTPFGP